MQTETFQLSLDNLQLVGLHWPTDRPKAVVVLLHGLGEHIERYHHVASFFQKQGYAFMGVDLPGHGKSEGKRGHLGSMENCFEIIHQLSAKAASFYPGVPAILYGHSMGGNILLYYLFQKNGVGYRGMIASAPWIQLMEKPQVFRMALARMMVQVYPGFSEKSGLDPNDISRDKEVVKAYIKDPLVHDKITAGTGTDLYDAGNWLHEYEGATPVPLLIVHGTADPITDARASEALAGRLTGPITFKSFPGLYHEPHNEPEKDTVLQFYLNWLQNVLVHP